MVAGDINGVINGATSNENIDVKLEWAAFHYPNAGYSTFYAELYYKRNNTGFTTSGTGTFTIYIIDSSNEKVNTKPVQTYVSITEDDWVKVAEYNGVNIGHSTDGKLSFTISASGSIPGTTLNSTTLSKGYTFDVRKASGIQSLSCTTNYFTGAMTYTFLQKGVGLYNQCNISLNLDGTYHAVKTINHGKSTSYNAIGTNTVTLSSSELETIYKKLPNVTSGKLRFTIRTYSDSGYSAEVAGSGAYKEITLTIPNDTTTQPTMTMALAPVSDFTSSSAIYVKDLSKVKATFTKYGATPASYKLTVAGKDYTSPYTSDYLTTAGSITVKATITDSRGYSRSYSQTITVLDYKKPALDSVTCSTSNFNGTITYKYTPANSSFYSRCVVSLGSTTIKTISLGQKAASQQTGTLTLAESELSTIYNAFPNGTSGTLKFTFRAFINSGYSEQIGTDSSKEITLSIPNIDATQPTATLTVAPESSLASPFNTLYIKGKSKAKATLASGAGKYGATIKSYKVTIGTQSGASPITSDTLLTTGDVTITGTVTDSRGYSRTYTQTISVIDHSTPRIIAVSGQSSVIAARCNANGELDSNGTGLLIAAKRAYSKVVYNNSQKNYCAIQFRYKVDGGSYSSWTDILARTATSDEVLVGPVANVTLDTLTTYVVQVRAIDDLGEAGSTTIFVSTEKVYMHRAGRLNSIGIGKYAEEENVVDIGEEMTTIFRGNVQFKSEAWISRALGTNVTASPTNSGRWGGTGVFYRVCAGGKHIYVAFNVSFTTSSSTVRADSETIPSAYRPAYDVYALCPVGFSDNSRGIATVSVSPSGRVNIYAVHKLPGATLSTGETVKWIDGYVDFWT